MARKTQRKPRKARAAVARSGAMMVPHVDGSPRLDPSGKHDLSTTEGTRRAMADFRNARLAAMDHYHGSFAENAEHMQEIDRLILSIMVDLSEHDMHDTLAELGRLATEAFHVRLFLEGESDPERRAVLVEEIGRVSGGAP